MDNPTNNYLYSLLEEEYILEGQAHTGFGIIITSTTANEVIAQIDDTSPCRYNPFGLSVHEVKKGKQVSQKHSLLWATNQIKKKGLMAKG